MSTNKTQSAQLSQDAVMQSVLKENDCRYGNYIVYGGSITQLNEKEMCHFFRFPETYKPIPLTEEWLLNLGFRTEESSCFELDDIHINTSRELMWVFTKCKNNIEMEMPEFVHQLQNLYFALANKELTLNK